MSEKQNSALIQKLYDSFAKGDIQTILESVTEDVEWGMEGPETIPYAGLKRGVAGVTQFFDSLTTTQTDMKLSVGQIIAQGDTVAMEGRYSFVAKATGRKVDSPIGHFFTIQNGKVARFINFGDTAAIADAYRLGSAAGSGA